MNASDVDVDDLPPGLVRKGTAVEEGKNAFREVISHSVATSSFYGLSKSKKSDFCGRFTAASQVSQAKFLYIRRATTHCDMNTSKNIAIDSNLRHENQIFRHFYVARDTMQICLINC